MVTGSVPSIHLMILGCLPVKAIEGFINSPRFSARGVSTIKIGILVNPMSGRDVRRLAARASTSTHQDKQIQVTRLILSALDQGVEEIVLIDEPFRISRRAVENLPIKNRVRFIKSSLTHTSQDTAEIALKMKELDCNVIIVMGGDGTNRIVAKVWPDANILPLSTGTNNVFPKMVEASVAGTAAGIVATNRLNAHEVARRCKQVHIETDKETDLALVDAVLLQNDELGNMLPYDTNKISDIILAISQPAAVGISPIGGYLIPSFEEDDFGVYIRCGEPAQKRMRVPVSPGLHKDIQINKAEKLELGEKIELMGPGILAFDGDREINLQAGETATLSVRRDGPWILDPQHILTTAANSGLFSDLRGENSK